MAKILVVGSFNMDLRFSMDRMPLEGETVLGSGLLYNPGGKGANQAAAAAKLGGQVAMLGAVGEDGFGEVLLQSLASCGADVSGVKKCTLPTGTASIYVDSAGKNSIVVIAGANGACDLDYLKSQAADEQIRNCDILMLQLEIPYDAVWHAAKRAHALGKTVILNPAPAPDGIPLDVLSACDWVTPNETELARLTGLGTETPEEIEAAAKKLLEMGAKGVLVTAGSRGALVCTSEGCQWAPGRKVRAIDTTAAGDCFSGAFAVALSEGKSALEAVKFANLAASIAVTREGAQGSIPSREEVDALAGTLGNLL